MPKPENDPGDFYADYHAWKGWDTFFAPSPDEIGYFRHELRGLALSGADVLEIGFGSGACLAWMQQQGARLCGTELSDVSCAAAAAKGVEILPPDLPAIARDHVDRFDTILAFDVFEHLPLPDVAAYLAACESMLRPGGQVLLRFPNAQSPFGLHPQMGDPTHRSNLSRSVIELLIAPQQLRVIRYGNACLYPGRPLSPRWFKRSLRRAVQALIGTLLRFAYASRIPYGPVAVIVLEKPR